MKITIDQAALKAALAPVERATAKGPALMEILKNILIDVTADHILLVGTDDITSVTVEVVGDIIEPGATTVEADLLAGLVGTLPAGPVTIHQPEGPLARIESAGGMTKLRTRFAGDFPRPPSADRATPVVTLKANYLARLIERVAISAAKDQSRPQLHGVHLRVRDGVLHLWAADGFRMSAQQVRLEDPSTPESATTIPAPAMRQLARILAPVDGDVTLSVTAKGSHLIADAGATIWTAKIIDGTYPDVLAILPKSSTTTATVGREALMQPIRRSLLITRSATEKLKGTMDLAVLASTIDVSAYDLTGSETLAAVDGDVTGPETRIRINGPYLVEALGAFDGERVTLAFNGENNHLTLRTPGNADHTQLVVPMIVGEH